MYKMSLDKTLNFFHIKQVMDKKKNFPGRNKQHPKKKMNHVRDSIFYSKGSQVLFIKNRRFFLMIHRMLKNVQGTDIGTKCQLTKYFNLSKFNDGTDKKRICWDKSPNKPSCLRFYFLSKGKSSTFQKKNGVFFHD